jgi:hypothetical protein
VTVKDLILKLKKIKDQDKQVLVSGESALKDFVWHEHISDHPHALVVRT